MSLSLLSASSWYFSQIYLTKNTGERKMQHGRNDQLNPEFEKKRGWSKMIFLKDQQGNQKVQAFLLVPHNMAACGAIIRLGWSPPLNINIGNLCLTRPCHGAAAATRSLQLPRKVWHNCLPANANAFMAWHASATSPIRIRTLILFIARLSSLKSYKNTQKDEDFKISNKDTEKILGCIVRLAPILLIARLYFRQTLQDQAGAWTWPAADMSGAVEYAGGGVVGCHRPASAPPCISCSP